MMPELLQKLRRQADFIRVIAKIEPEYLRFSIPQILVSAAVPLLHIYFPRHVIEQLTQAVPYGDIVRTVLCYALLLCALGLCGAWLGHRCRVLQERFPKKLQGDIGRTVMSLELWRVESASFRDLVRLAGNAAGLTQSMTLLREILSGAVSILLLSYVIIQLDFLFVALVLGTLTVKILLTRRYFQRVRRVRPDVARNERAGAYLHITGNREGAAKEIRVNSLQDWFFGKIRDYRKTMVAFQYRDFRRYHLYGAVNTLAMAAQSFVILSVLALRYTAGQISIADFTMYFSAVTALTAALSGLAEQIEKLGEQSLDVSDYRKLESLGTPPAGAQGPPPQTAEIVFRDVSFTYPGAAAPALEGISLTVRGGEHLYVAGPNGAGKTTFIKLLCKIYRPPAGVITLNGTDIWDIPNPAYYRRVAAVFQDFRNFAFSIRENAALGEAADPERIAEILEDLGMPASAYPKGYDTPVSRNFDAAGIELSGGQAQKLAIARALYKNTPVIILDEPTANLDPQSESDIYRQIFRTAAGKTAVFVSHRLAAASAADTVAVFDRGRVAEYGSHRELIRRGGLYCTMYRTQSAAYAEPAPAGAARP